MKTATVTMEISQQQKELACTTFLTMMMTNTSVSMPKSQIHRFELKEF